MPPLSKAHLPGSRFRRRLLDWYDRHRRNLPWRRTKNPYRIWVSEVMLQQTQAVTVIGYYERFLKALPAIADLAKAPKDRLMKLWEKLGYYARARNLQAAARLIAERHGGKIPRDPKLFSALPGAGPYTTAAVLSIAFGAPIAAVDGNVKRVIARLLDINRPILPNDAEVLETAQQLLSRKRPGDFNQALMELGAVVCAPKNPACPICPVRLFCLARRRGTVSCRPVPAEKKVRPHIRVVAAVLRKNGRVLVGRRPDRGLLGGLWEFPGGKVEGSESDEEALRRELWEELGIDAKIGPSRAQVRHAYTHFSITLSGHFCETFRKTPQPKVHSALKWVEPAGLKKLAMPEANRKLLRQLEEKNLI